jgi:hypothetical protein
VPTSVVRYAGCLVKRTRGPIERGVSWAITAFILAMWGFDRGDVDSSLSLPVSLGGAVLIAALYAIVARRMAKSRDAALASDWDGFLDEEPGLVELVVLTNHEHRPVLQEAMREVAGELASAKVRRVAAALLSHRESWTHAGVRVSAAAPGRAELSYRDAIQHAESSALAASQPGDLVVVVLVVSLARIVIPVTDSAAATVSVLESLAACADADAHGVFATSARTDAPKATAAFPIIVDLAPAGPFR